MKKTSEEKIICNFCGDELTEKNSISGSYICIHCQSQYFERMEKENGCHIAIFLTCGMANIPCLPLYCPIDIVNHKGDKWAYYIKSLKDNLERKDRPLGFMDGVTDLRRIFGKELTEKDFSRYIKAEKDKIAMLQGTAEQRERWGTTPLCEGYPMTTDLYNKLDTQLDLWTARYKGQNSPQIEQTLITIVSRNEVADYLFRKGDYASAQKVQKMVDDLMASEQMRKKDEKPVEAARIDAFVVALENLGAMEDGLLLTCDEVIEAIRDKHIKSKKYSYSVDAADQMLVDYINTMRLNCDLPIITELDEDTAVEDAYGEFEAEETEREKGNKKYAKLTPVKVVKRGKDNADRV